MTGLTNIVLLVLRYALYGKENLSEEERDELNQVSDWRAVLNELRYHAVYALPYPILDELKIEDTELYAEWRKLCLQTQKRWIQLAHEQNELLKLFERNDIPCVVIKGMAAGLSYPAPYLRSPGDIDILVKREDFGLAATVLENNEYRLTSDISQVTHHNDYEKYKAKIELHRWLGNLKETEEELIELFEEGISNRHSETVLTYSIPVLPSALNGLVLLYHIEQHIRTGIGLRQILDWVMYVNKYVDDAFWSQQLSPLLEKVGRKSFALSLTGMCQEFLGLRRDIKLCASVDHDVCDELMDYIMSRGNFGNKINADDQIASFWITAKNPRTFFRRLQRGGMSRWKAAKRHKVLKPFAWIYQIGFILGQLKKQNRDISQMRDLHDVGVLHRRLMEKIGLDY